MGLIIQSHVQFILDFWSYIVLYRCSTENLFPIAYGTRILVTCSITSNLVPCSIDWNFDPTYNWELGLKIQSHEHCSWFLIFGPIYVTVHQIKILIQFEFCSCAKLGLKFKSHVKLFNWFFKCGRNKKLQFFMLNLNLMESKLHAFFNVFAHNGILCN
jgi:hypothetical protein